VVLFTYDICAVKIFFVAPALSSPEHLWLKPRQTPILIIDKAQIQRGR
jgi:hypothetical protein